jgi:hypothetical protein
VLSEFLPPQLCASFQFVVYSSGFWFLLFFVGGGVSLPRGLFWFIPGMAGGIPHESVIHLFGLPNVSQAGLEPVAGSSSPHVFSVQSGMEKLSMGYGFRVWKF